MWKHEEDKHLSKGARWRYYDVVVDKYGDRHCACHGVFTTTALCTSDSPNPALRSSRTRRHGRVQSLYALLDPPPAYMLLSPSLLWPLCSTTDLKPPIPGHFPFLTSRRPSTIQFRRSDYRQAPNSSHTTYKETSYKSEKTVRKSHAKFRHNFATLFESRFGLHDSQCFFKEF
jgi:hypothetical protein